MIMSIVSSRSLMIKRQEWKTFGLQLFVDIHSLSHQIQIVKGYLKMVGQSISDHHLIPK